MRRQSMFTHNCKYLHWKLCLYIQYVHKTMHILVAGIILDFPSDRTIKYNLFMKDKLELLFCMSRVHVPRYFCWLFWQRVNSLLLIQNRSTSERITQCWYFTATGYIVRPRFWCDRSPWPNQTRHLLSQPLVRSSCVHIAGCRRISMSMTYLRHVRLNPNPCGWGRIWLPKLWRGMYISATA